MALHDIHPHVDELLLLLLPDLLSMHCTRFSCRPWVQAFCHGTARHVCIQGCPA